MPAPRVTGPTCGAAPPIAGNSAHATLPGLRRWTGTTPSDFMDSRGNWLKVVRVLNGTVTRQARTRNEVNEYTTIDLDNEASPPDPVTLTHDANGNLTADPTAPNVGTYADGQEYVYDGENRLVEVIRTYDTPDQTLLEIHYDAIGRRVESIEHVDPSDGSPYATAKRTRHIHAGLNVVEEYDIVPDVPGSYFNILAREFVWGNSFPEPVALIDHTDAGDVSLGTAEVLHYLRDVLGNVVALTNANGDVVERYWYDAYGPTHIEDTDPTTGAVRRVGQIADAQRRIAEILERAAAEVRALEERMGKDGNAIKAAITNAGADAAAIAKAMATHRVQTGSLASRLVDAIERRGHRMFPTPYDVIRSRWAILPAALIPPVTYMGIETIQRMRLVLRAVSP